MPSQLRRTAAAGFCLLLASPLCAAAGGGIESMDRPSARPLPAPYYVPPKPPEGLTAPPSPEAEALAADTRKIPLHRIVLEGGSVFPETELRALVQAYEGREVLLGEVEELRQALTRHYIEAGYINSGAVIPEGGYRDGELHIRLIEGRLDEVRIRGQQGLRPGYLQSRLQGDPEQPFNLKELQDRFQWLLSDPLIGKMNGRILPGAEPGHGILDVEVTRARAYQLSLFGNNYRPPSIGAEAFGVGGWVRNITGFGDLLEFNYLTSQGSDRYFGGFTVPITYAGSQVFFHFDEGESQVIEAPVDRLRIRSLVHSLEGGFSHPFLQTLSRQFSAGASLSLRQNETTLLGRPYSFVPGEPTGQYQATVWRLFQDYMQRFDRHAVAFRSTFSVGMNALGALPERNPNDPDSEFFAWLGQGQYAYLLPDDVSQLVLRGNLQLSDSPLLPLERMAVGGVGSVRGYRENHLVRDEGYNVSVELRYPLWGSSPDSRHRLTLVPFWDYGEAWNIGQKSDALYSIGLGIHWQFRPIHAEFHYGHALHRPTPHTRGDLQDDGVHFQVRMDAF